VHKLEVECKAVQTRHETKQLELKNELDRHSRDRSQLLEDHNQKLDEIHLTNTAVVRCFLVPSVLFGVVVIGSCCRLLVFGVGVWCCSCSLGSVGLFDGGVFLPPGRSCS